MSKQLAVAFVLIGSALAQDNADIPPRFRTFIAPDDYFRMRDDYLNRLRGLPAPPGLRDKAIQQMQLQHIGFSLLTTLGTTPSWMPLGPSPIPNGQVAGSLPVTGRVTSFEIDPTNTNKLYLGTAQGGIYRSLDGGLTWGQIFDMAQSSAIGALALAPSNHTTLYVGTGEANLSIDSYAGVGLYRIDNADTTATLVGPINPVRIYNDAGGNPQSVPVFNGRAIASILVHPTDPSTVFVGTAGAVIGIGADAPLGGTIPPLGMRGLYRLTNATGPAAGVAAQKLTVTLAPGGFDSPNTGNRNVMSMVFEPGNPNNLTVWVLGNAATGDGGIYRSTNAQAANPSFTQVLTTTTSGTRAQLASYKTAGSPAVIYAASGEGGNGRLRVSTDGGATWSGFLTGGQGFCGAQCFYNIGLDLVPGPARTQDTIVLGGNTPGGGPTPSRLFAKSSDGGATFTESSSGLHADTHFIRIDPTNPNVIYHGDDGGIFKSINGGATWSSLNISPINDVQFQSVSLHPHDPNFSLGGTQDNGTNLRMPDGSWKRVDFGDGGYALIDRNAVDTSNVTMYHTYFNATNALIGFARVDSVACAADFTVPGTGWFFRGVYGGFVSSVPECGGSDVFNGISITDPVLFYAPMELGPGNPSPVYFGAGPVYRSANKGDTVIPVSQSSSTQPVSSIAVSPQDDNYRMFGRTDGSIFYTTTGSNPMQQLFGIPSMYIARVKFDPSNKNTAYVALGGYFGGTTSSQSHVWKVTNLNTVPVVTGINNGLPDVPVNALAIDPANNTLFAGTDIGVYESLDNGATWAPFGSGLPVVAVFGSEIQQQGRKLRIATHGRGMWEIGLPAALPDLTVTKTHVGNFNAGQIGATYTLTATNVGGSPTVGTVSVADVLPSGMTATAESGIGWTCNLANLTCTRTDALAAGAAYPPITLTVNVAPNAPGLLLNTATVSGGGEINTSNDTATDSTVVSGGINLPQNLTLTPGQPAPFPVMLLTPAGPNGVFITLASSDPSKVALPPPNSASTTFFMPPGATNKTVNIYGVDFGSATITASGNGLVSSTTVVKVAGTLTLSPSTTTLVGVPTQKSLTLTLSSPAPTGLTVHLSSDNPGVATVPSATFISPGAMVALVPVTSTGVGTTIIHANALPIAPDTTANITVVSRLAVVTTALPNGHVGVPYSFTLKATGGTAPYFWALLSGALPDGLTLNRTTGVISGTPTGLVVKAPLEIGVTDSSIPVQAAETLLTLTVTQ